MHVVQSPSRRSCHFSGIPRGNSSEECPPCPSLLLVASLCSALSTVRALEKCPSLSRKVVSRAWRPGLTLEWTLAKGQAQVQRAPSGGQCLLTRPPHPASGLAVMPAFTPALFPHQHPRGSLSFPCAFRSSVPWPGCREAGQCADGSGSVPGLLPSLQLCQGPTQTPRWGHNLQPQLGGFSQGCLSRRGSLCPRPQVPARMAPPCPAQQSFSHWISWQLWFLWQLGETCNCGFLKSKLGAEV